MRPPQHAIVSVGSGILLGGLLRSWTAGISCCLIGMLVDVDHLFDFWLNRGLSLDRGEFFDFCYYGKSRKFFAIFHGYEFIPVLSAATALSGWDAVGWGLTAGYVIHILSDQLFNTHLNGWTYFLSYRLYHRFDSAKIVKGTVPIAP